MKNIGSKEYFELYAKLSLVHLIDIDYQKLLIIDKPDLQSKELSLGIEVTRSIDENMGLTNAIVNDCFDKNMQYTDFESKVIKRKHFKGEIFQVNGTNVISHTKGLYDTNYVVALIEKSILDKLDKLNGENYTIFDKNELYIFTGTGIINESELLCKLIDIGEKHLNFKLVFDRYYINCLDFLYAFNCENNCLKKIDIDKETLKKLKTESLI